MLLNNVTVIDFETSGLNFEKDRVIEMAAIRCVNGKIVSEFSTLITYDGKISPKITEITGILDEDLICGLDEDTAFKILNKFIADSIIVAHNAAFDLGFLHYTLKRLAKRSFSNEFIDTLTICRDIHNYPHTLLDMCKKYEIEITGAHRASYDALSCWNLFEKLHTEIPLNQYINKLGYLRKYGPPKWYPDFANIVPQENNYESKDREIV